MPGVPQGVERRLLSVRAARDAFAGDDRAKLHIIEFAAFGARVAVDFTTYFRDLADWFERAGPVLRSLPLPPPVPDALSRAPSALATVMIGGEHLRTTVEALIRVASLAPEAARAIAEAGLADHRTQDVRWIVGGVFALVAADSAGVALRPSDLALVAVAAGIDNPLNASDHDGDEALRQAYAGRADRWRKRLDRIRPVVETLLAAVRA